MEKTNTIFITDIEWSIDINEAVQTAFDKLDDSDFRQLIGVCKDDKNAAVIAKEVLENDPNKVAMIYELPTGVDIPVDIVKLAVKENNSDIIEDYISTIYEFAVNSYCMPKEFENQIIEADDFDIEEEPNYDF